MLVPISFLLFDLAQWEGAVWAFCLPIYLANFTVVAAVICLERSQGVDRWLAWALASGAVASLSFATGILVWPIGLIQLMLRPAPHRRRSLAVWAAGAASALSLFWARYPMPEAGLPVGPGRALAFVAGLWGSPFSESLAVAAGIGAVALTCAIALLVLARSTRGLLADNAATVALLAFGFLSAIMIMKGRAGMAATYAVQSRYTPIVAIGWIGLYLLAVEVLGARSGSLALGARRLVAVLLVAGVAHASVAGWKHGVTDRRWRSHSASILADYRLQRDEVLAAFLHRDVAMVRRLATFLESNHLSVFAAPDRQGDR